MERQVRTVYLYLFALLGLVFMSIGGIRLTDLALRAFVFTSADREERHRMEMPPMPPVRVAPDGAAAEPLTEPERAMLVQWQADYERWRDEGQRIDPVHARRDRTAASSLAMILIGLPLYLYHYRRIRAELGREA